MYDKILVAVDHSEASDRALLAARCEDARRQGCDLALVKGRVETSGPVLRRAGFTAYDAERCFQHES